MYRLKGNLRILLKNIFVSKEKCFNKSVGRIIYLQNQYSFFLSTLYKNNIFVRAIERHYVLRCTVLLNFTNGRKSENFAFIFSALTVSTSILKAALILFYRINVSVSEPSIYQTINGTAFGTFVNTEKASLRNA